MSARKALRTDGDIARAIGRAQRLLWQFTDILSEIETSEHPNAGAMYEALITEGYGVVADLPAIVHRYLLHPERVKQCGYSGPEARRNR